MRSQSASATPGPSSTTVNAAVRPSRPTSMVTRLRACRRALSTSGASMRSTTSASAPTRSGSRGAITSTGTSFGPPAASAARRAARAPSLVPRASPVSARAAAIRVSRIPLICSALRCTAASASRYSGPERSRRSASSVSASRLASGVRSSCESSPEKRCSRRRLAARRSRSRSKVAARRVSSSRGSPAAKRWSRSCSLQSASVMRATGRSAPPIAQRAPSAIATSSTAANTSEASRAVCREFS